MESHLTYLNRMEEQSYDIIQSHVDELCAIVHDAAQGDEVSDPDPKVKLALALLTLLVIRQERRDTLLSALRRPEPN